MKGPYRKLHREVDVDTEDADKALAVVRVSGPDGAHGRDGSDGASGSGSGGDGRRGGNASEAVRGVDAGSISLTLSKGDTEGFLHLTGMCRFPDGSTKEYEESILIGHAGTLDLSANGGRGGDGGDGGRGGHGASGRSGSNATRYSSGGNGGDGGDGGDGGSATSGARGGDAGSIELKTRESETQLLILVNHELKGGWGGDAGSNGAGGAAGSGGRGGSSYSWTESQSYTDSNGNHQTRTTYHSKPGGHSGSPGSSGYASNAKVSKGAKGNSKSIEIVVEGEKGVARYNSCYNLSLESFSHVSVNADAVYEPGERIRVFDIVARNVGGMPTPTKSELISRLLRSSWVYPEEESLVVPPGLDSGQSVELEGELNFKIGDYTPKGPSDPLEVEESVHLRATLPEVKRDFPAFENTDSEECGKFLIRFPLRISEIESLHSLAPGEISRVRWDVVNQSTAALGRDSQSGRILRVILNLHESNLGAEDLVFINPEGNVESFANGYVKEIPLLDGGECASIEVALGIREGVQHYRSSTIRLTLELGHVSDPTDLRAIQFREFTTRVGRPYNAHPGTELLLVVNQGSTAEELAAWERLAANFGVSLNIWDISLMGHLDLLKESRGSSLLEELAGQTIVLLDCEILSGSGPVRPHAFLDKAQVFAAAKRGINFSYLGPDFGLDKLLIRTDNEDGAWATTPDQLCEVLEEARDDLSDVLKGQDCSLKIEDKMWRWSVPTEARLIEVALNLQTRLCNEHPDRRYLAVYEFEPELVSKGLVSQTCSLGNIHVVATLDSAAGTTVHAKMDERSLHDPEVILGDESLVALLLTMSLGEKLVRIKELLYRDSIPALLGDLDESLSEHEEGFHAGPEADHLLTLIVDAICADVANEMAAVLATRWRSGLSADQVERSMPLLRELCGFVISEHSPHPPGSPGGNHLLRLIARLRFCLLSQARFWEWLPPFIFTRRAIAVRNRSSRLLKEFTAACFGEHTKTAEAHIKQQLRYEKRLHKETRKKNSATDKKRWKYSQALLQEPIHRLGITTDAELMSTPGERVLSKTVYDAVHKADEDASARRMELVASSADFRKTLLRSETTSSYDRSLIG